MTTPLKQNRRAKTILIVDDAKDSVRLLGTFLHANGYIARVAFDGLSALTQAKNAPPDLILLDILLPDIKGYEVCERLKADDATRHIPVIFLSALDEPLDKINAFRVGGADYLTKPYHELEAMARIEMHLEALGDLAFTVEGRRFAMDKGETIHTENSHKFTDRSSNLLLLAGGWTPTRRWLDEAGRFSLILAEAAVPRNAP